MGQKMKLKNITSKIRRSKYLVIGIILTIIPFYLPDNIIKYIANPAYMLLVFILSGLGLFEISIDEDPIIYFKREWKKDLE